MEFYPGMTPGVFYDLEEDEYRELKGYIDRRAKEAEQVRNANGQG